MARRLSRRCLLQKGDCLEIIFPIENSNIQPENIPLKIIYEDDYYIIIDKESQMPCIPTKRYQSHTLCHALMYYYQQIGLKSTIHLVNRLDKETSGYMLVAKTSQAHALLSKDIKQVERVYHCLVEGILEGEGDILTSTPRQLALLRLWGFEPPAYAHIPLLLDGQGERLAKRHQSLGVRERPLAAFAPLARRKIRSNNCLLLFLGADSGKTVKNAVKS